MTLPPEQSEALLACPFCPTTYPLEICRGGLGEIAVICVTCGATGPTGYQTIGEAVAAWNTRSLALQPGGEG